jgi:hypothetical protein
LQPLNWLARLRLTHNPSSSRGFRILRLGDRAIKPCDIDTSMCPRSRKLSMTSCIGRQNKRAYAFICPHLLHLSRDRDQVQFYPQRDTVPLSVPPGRAAAGRASSKSPSSAFKYLFPLPGVCGDDNDIIKRQCILINNIVSWVESRLNRCIQVVTFQQRSFKPVINPSPRIVSTKFNLVMTTNDDT